MEIADVRQRLGQNLGFDLRGNATQVGILVWVYCRKVGHGGSGKDIFAILRQCSTFKCAL
jgi:hypothetical protein